MKPDEIKRIAAHALAGTDRILNHWLPGGKTEGHEYQALNPKRADSSLGSFSINIRTGEWADFATGDKGKDLVSLVAYLTDATQSDAAKMVAELLGIATKQNAPQNRGRYAPKDAGKGKASPQPKESNSAQPDKDSANDGWDCVMPIPDDAPPPPEAHSKHGKYDQRYPYLNTDGRVNYYHDRWEPKEAGGKKQFAPLTLWRKDGRFKWQFKAPPEPRPLYGLPSLVQYPDAWVWIVEGEKAAKALGKLLPEHPILCWQGGSLAVDKSDFRPLKGRRVRIWPDHDKAGERATGELIKQLEQAEAAEIEVLNLDRVAYYKPAFYDTEKGSIPKIDRGSVANLHPGDDAHDLLKRDRWTAEHFHLLLTIGVPELFLTAHQDDDTANQSRAAQPANQNEAADASIPESEGTPNRQAAFEVDDSGVYHLQQDKDGSLRRRKMCNKLEVLAQSRDPNGGQWGKLVQFSDPDNRLKRIVIPARAFNGDGLEATGRLLEEGLAIMPKARSLVLQYLQEQCPSERVRTTNRTGWHGINDELVFVLPDGSIGQSEDEWLFADDRPDSSLFRQRGTLKQWRDHVAVLCSGNSRLTFAVSVAFAAPLLHLIEMESGGFHYRGTTSSGKTSALYMAGSVCGSPEYLQRWRSTDNGLESIALSHCDVILTLDELKMIDARIAGESAYMLANGSAKVRAKQNGGARNTAKWRLLFLSAGELSLSQHVAEVGKRTPTGAELRMADIPADAGHGMGCFENLHGYANGHEFAKALGVTVNKYYGTAFPAFVEQILKNRESLRDSLADARLKFEKTTLTSAASGQAQRVGARFALVGAAGELATHWGITGWQPGASMQAAMTCFKSWLQAFGGEGNKEERAMIEQVRHFLELHGEARFTDIDRSVVEDNHTPRTMNKAGFREKNAEGNLEYYCYPEVFKAEICKGFDHQAIARLLIARGFMKGDGKHLKPKVNLPGEGRKRVFHILPTIWGDEND
ncbi:Uncharcterized protein, DUF927 family [Nitrosomonas nitrosa]|uniref:Uncharcterized protein, DUF927 family n=1 Tax=Nitrosomonas nitrosa TaxID=52442 RepID=A0A1I4KS45_9PROT|nr:DUF927 domain-containing protein [Nitrosomonas nitrosa]SFL81642.1 Uncharcterized protein, DUF927 family [Nitrosomonas nitrosa]